METNSAHGKMNHRGGDWAGVAFVRALCREVNLFFVERSKQQIKGVRNSVEGFGDLDYQLVR